MTAPGTYEFRLFLNNGYTLAATSPTITATVGTPPALAVSTTTAAPGTPVTMTLTNGYGGGTDWLALAPTGSPEQQLPSVHLRRRRGDDTNMDGDHAEHAGHV